MDIRTLAAPKARPRFEAKRWIVAQHGKTAIVRLVEGIRSVAALEQRDILIDGCSYRCARVITAAHPPPFQVGEYVLLLVETPE